jgi:hypothetical protein
MRAVERLAAKGEILRAFKASPAARRWAPPRLAPLGASGRRWLTAAGGARREQVLQAAWPTTPLRAGATALIFLSFYVRPRRPHRPAAPPRWGDLARGGTRTSTVFMGGVLSGSGGGTAR